MTPSERVKKIEAETSGVKSLYNITSWESTFMDSISDRSFLSPKQEATLKGIEEKVFGESDE